jgi:hypothetical protein
MLPVAPHGIDWFTSQAFTRTGLADLPAHLQQHYGIAVADVAELDIGVYRVIRAGPLTMTCWSLAVGHSRGPTAAADLGTNTKLAWTIANRAIDALRTPSS